MTNLFISYYKASTTERQAEIDYCLKANCENPLIDRVFILSNWELFKNLKSFEKTVFVDFVEKPTYKDFIRIVNEYIDCVVVNEFSANYNKENDVNIISNADIIFDETLSNLDKLKENDCWALSRWEMNEKFEKHVPQIQIYGDSQDCWIFRGKIRQFDKSDFPLGKMGCDNRIAYEIKKAGYNISNPSKSVFTWHLHNSNVRGYNPAIRNENTVVSQPYLNVPITSL